MSIVTCEMVMAFHQFLWLWLLVAGAHQSVKIYLNVTKCLLSIFVVFSNLCVTGLLERRVGGRWWCKLTYDKWVLIKALNKYWGLGVFLSQKFSHIYSWQVYLLKQNKKHKIYIYMTPLNLPTCSPYRYCIRHFYNLLAWLGCFS